MSNLSRRQFAALAGTGLLARPNLTMAAGALTAGEVVNRIKQNLHIPWNDKTYRDTFKIGGPDMEVKGIVTSFMSTYDILQRMVKAGKNMIVTHEPTFWSDADVVKDVEFHQLYKEKLEFAKKNNLIVWRFHDHWHARKPDGIFTGWNKALKWPVDTPDGKVWHIPETTLEEVGRHVAKNLGSRSIRMIGDPKLRVKTVARGAHTLSGNMEVLPTTDALLVSEAREWDSIEYIRDTIQMGEKRGLILIAHEIGEETGMTECAEWLKGFVKEVPIEFMNSHEAFWIPA
jgi:putative NIF3 family GTP cyclohydrolase 1 type 2